MLDVLHIENYKCLRDVRVELGDFTILIGPNDSGKTSFLQAIQTLGKIARQPFTTIPLADLVWRKESARCIKWEASGTTAADHKFVYRIEVPVIHAAPHESLVVDGRKLFWTDELARDQGLAPNTVLFLPRGAGKEKHAAEPGSSYLQRCVVRQPQEPYSSIAEVLNSSIEYQFALDKLASPAVPQPGVALHPSGANLAAVLDVLQNSPDRSVFENLQKSLHEAIPTLQGIVLPPAGQPQGAKALEFILSGNGQPPVTIPASLASGGALLLTAFLTLAYTETPALLLFEEPENGLHPSRLQFVIDILRKISRGEVGNRKHQVILTTHNPLLLNYAKPEEVRVFFRHPDDFERGTQVVPMKNVRDMERLLKEFALGELWYLLGEEKLVEGQPA